jgi:hypothetical protein
MRGEPGMYFERCTRLVAECDRSIQTSMLPEHAVQEYSWDHPGFHGTLEVVVQAIQAQRPALVPYVYAVSGPGAVQQIDLAPINKQEAGPI